jgi:uncharacterized membrane protein
MPMKIRTITTRTRTETKTKKPAGDSFQLQNIHEIIELEKREKITMTMSDKIASTITAFSGSMIYVLLHVVWFGIWILINFGLIHGVKPFDPFPFSLLTMIVSLEAIFLSSFVLISQNKQAQQADKRAKVDLQINMIAERENTKLIKMVADIHEHLRISKQADPEVRQLKKTTQVNKLADQIDREEAKAEGKKLKKLKQK